MRDRWSLVEDRQLEITKAHWVGDQADLDDPSCSIANSKATRGRPPGASTAPCPPLYR
jgi:hypothetical protein